MESVQRVVIRLKGSQYVISHEICSCTACQYVLLGMYGTIDRGFFLIRFCNKLLGEQ